MKKGHRFKNSVLFRLFCCKTLALMAVYLFFRRFLGWYRFVTVAELLALKGVEPEGGEVYRSVS